MKSTRRTLNRLALGFLLVFALVGCATTQKDWGTARRADTVAAYQGFLEKHPKSKFEKWAGDRILELDWQQALKDDSKAAYQGFRADHPGSPHEEQAAKRIEALDFENAKKENTIQAYKAFLSAYPKGEHAEAARIQRLNLLNTGLIEAVTKGRVKEIRELLAKGADPNFTTPEKAAPLLMAASGGDTDIAALLIDAGAKVEAANESGKTALMLAAEAGHEALANLLLKKGADPNTVQRGEKLSGFSALHWAVSAGNASMARLLVEAGADLDARSAKGSTPLATAAQKKNLPLVKWLLVRGATLNTTNNYGLSALMIAFNVGADDVVEYLLEQGAAIDQTDKSGNTVFMYAAASGRTKVVKRMMAQGVDIDVKNLRGETALSLARENGHKEVARILAQARYNTWKSAMKKAENPAGLRVLGAYDLLLDGQMPKQPLVAVVVEVTGLDGAKPIYLNPALIQLGTDRPAPAELAGLLLMRISDSICAELVGRLFSADFGLGAKTWSTSPSGPYYDGKLVVKLVSGGFSMISGAMYASSGSVVRLMFNRQGQKDECPFDEGQDLTLVTFVPPTSPKEKRELKEDKADKIISLQMCGPLAIECGATIYAPRGETLRVGLLFKGIRKDVKTLRFGKKKLRL